MTFLPFLPFESPLVGLLTALCLVFTGCVSTQQYSAAVQLDEAEAENAVAPVAPRCYRERELKGTRQVDESKRIPQQRHEPWSPSQRSCVRRWPTLGAEQLSRTRFSPVEQHRRRNRQLLKASCAFGKSCRSGGSFESLGADLNEKSANCSKQKANIEELESLLEGESRR